MEASLVSATTTSQKAEREYIALKESLNGMMEGWGREVRAVKEGIRSKEEKWEKEREALASKYRGLVELQRAAT